MAYLTKHHEVFRKVSDACTAYLCWFAIALLPLVVGSILSFAYLPEKFGEIFAMIAFIGTVIAIVAMVVGGIARCLSINHGPTEEKLNETVFR